jgi:hypothetical protein
VDRHRHDTGTARRSFDAISGLQDIGKLVDSVLYVAK